jgi:hypothetical protein
MKEKERASKKGTIRTEISLGIGFRPSPRKGYGGQSPPAGMPLRDAVPASVVFSPSLLARAPPFTSSNVILRDCGSPVSLYP